MIISDTIIQEHERLLKTKIEDINSDNDVKIICEDGEVWYSRILLYLMNQQYKTLLLECCPVSEVVIIDCSSRVSDFVEYYSVHSRNIRTESENKEDTVDEFDTLSNEEVCELPTAFYCEVCGRCYSSVKKLKAHKKSQHKSDSKEDFACGVCGKIFMHKYQLTKHEVIHNEPSFVCANCDQKFRRRQALLRHYEHFHDGSKSKLLFQCPVCNLKFSRTENLLRHTRIHDTSEFKCSHCDSTFKRSDSLKRHIKLKHS